MHRLRFSTARAFESLLECATATTTAVVWEFEPGGLRVRAVNSTVTVYVQAELPAAAFIEYVCPARRAVELEARPMAQKLKAARGAACTVELRGAVLKVRLQRPDGADEFTFAARPLRTTLGMPATTAPLAVATLDAAWLAASARACAGELCRLDLGPTCALASSAAVFSRAAMAQGAASMHVSSVFLLELVRACGHDDVTLSFFATPQGSMLEAVASIPGGVVRGCVAVA